MCRFLLRDMRNAYPPSFFYAAIASWERHKQQYLANLQSMHQPLPNGVELENYKQIWLEGYLEALADAQDRQTAQGSAA